MHIQRFDVGCHGRDIGEAKLSGLALKCRILIKTLSSLENKEGRKEASNCLKGYGGKRIFTPKKRIRHRWTAD